MRHLAENWDGYGAAAPQSSIIGLAEEVVSLIQTLLHTNGVDTIHVGPTRVGGVLIEWESTTVEHEIDIAPDRSISFLHYHKATGQIQTRKFSPEPAVVQPGFLQELHQSIAA